MKTPHQISIMLSIPDKLNRRRSVMLTSNNNPSLTKMSVCEMLLLISSLSATTVSAQELPLVYDQENTGANFPQPTLLSYDQLPFIRPLPDPFAWEIGRASCRERV